MNRWLDAVRLAVGTLTVVPVRPPQQLDRTVAARAMTVAPLVGLLLAVPLVLLAVALQPDPRPAGTAGPSALLVAVLVIGLLAGFTRGMHLDGLADTADGLGSGKPADQALAVMRQSDIGPFGVVTLVLVLLAQVAALAQLTAHGRGAPAVAVALVVSRLALPLACSRGIPAARPEGLGHLVAGTVSRAALLVSVLLAVGGVLAAVALAAGVSPTATLGVPAVGPGRLVAVETTGPPLPLALVLVTLVPLGLTGLFLRRCVHRLGGVTGDVLGACVEVCFTVTLVVLALAG